MMNIIVLSKNRHVRYLYVLLLFALLGLVTYQFKFKAKPKALHPPEDVPFRRSPPDILVSEDLPDVMCLVITSPSTYQDRGRHVAATWGLKSEVGSKERMKKSDELYLESCPNTVFVTSDTRAGFKSAIYTKYASYEEIWGKVLVAFRSVNVSRADWFMKADDDTFIVYSRLQRLLTKFDSKEPIFLGFNLIHTFEDGREVEYMSGGAGYLLSAPAAKMLQNTHLKECQYPGATPYEDVNMGICMTTLGVRYGDTRDPLGRPVFLPYPAQTFFDPDASNHPDILWMNSLSKYPIRFGIQHLSDRVVSFHEVRNPTELYLLQYFTHHLRLHSASEATPFGRL